MSRIGHLARSYWFDAVIGLLTVEAMIELAVRRDDSNAPSTTLAFTIPAVGLMALPLFARRRFPFAAPAAYWLIDLSL